MFGLLELRSKSFFPVGRYFLFSQIFAIYCMSRGQPIFLHIYYSTYSTLQNDTIMPDIVKFYPLVFFFLLVINWIMTTRPITWPLYMILYNAQLPLNIIDTWPGRAKPKESFFKFPAGIHCTKQAGWWIVVRWMHSNSGFLKGQCHEIFHLRFFSSNNFSWSQRAGPETSSNFSEYSWSYLYS